jgi:VWFA-related protein
LAGTKGRPRFGIQIGKSPAAAGGEFLSKAVQLTGGNLFEFAGQRDLAIALEKALAEMRSRYSLTYTPSPANDRGGYHKIRVRMKRDGLIARTRDGYLIPK